MTIELAVRKEQSLNEPNVIVPKAGPKRRASQRGEECEVTLVAASSSQKERNRKNHDKIILK